MNRELRSGCANTFVLSRILVIHMLQRAPLLAFLRLDLSVTVIVIQNIEKYRVHRKKKKKQKPANLFELNNSVISFFFFSIPFEIAAQSERLVWDQIGCCFECDVVAVIVIEHVLRSRNVW